MISGWVNPFREAVVRSALRSSQGQEQAIEAMIDTGFQRPSDISLSPVGAAFWLLQPSERLGGWPPIELLRRRRPEPILELAREQSFLP
jgi:hypothetical protein